MKNEKWGQLYPVRNIMYCVYVLTSLKDKQFCIGYTEDLFVYEVEPRKVVN
jgi:hypothetical protein